MFKGYISRVICRVCFSSIDPPKMAAHHPSQSNEPVIRIVLVGGAGAGKAPLMWSVFGIEGLAPLGQYRTAKIQTKEGVVGGIRFVITHPGFSLRSVRETTRQLEHVKHHIETRNNGITDLFIYCLPVSIGSTFDIGNHTMMQSLQSIFGQDIWRKCIVALTYSDEVQERIQQMTGESGRDAIAQYKQLLNDCANNFQYELIELKVHNITVKTVFGFDLTSRDQNTIPAIPVGEEPDDPVLPDIHSSEKEEIRRLNWKEVFITEILKKSDATLLEVYKPTVIIARVPGHKEAYKKAIQENVSVQIRAVRLNLVGLPRSGKTSFLRRMMGEILNIMAAIARGEKEQPSTGVAEAGGQVFIRSETSRSVGTITSKEWSILRDLVEEAGMFGNILYQTVQDKPTEGVDPPNAASSTNRRDQSSAGRPSANKEPSVWQY